MHTNNLNFYLLIFTFLQPNKSDKMSDCRRKKSDYFLQPGLGWDSVTSTTKRPIFLTGQINCNRRARFLKGENVYLTNVQELLVRSDLLGYHRNVFYPVTALNMTLKFHPWNPIDGFLTKGYANLFRRKIQERKLTNRILVRYVIFRLELNSDCPIHPHFEERIDEIMNELEFDDIAMAEYKLDLIVRDYGTHYIVRTDTGAIFMQQDFLSFDFVSEQNPNDIDDLSVAGKELFLRDCPFGVNLSKNVPSDLIANYLHDANYKGKSFKFIGGNKSDVCSSPETWKESPHKNMEVVDRFGPALHEIISQTVFPKFKNYSRVRQLRRLLSDAIGRYYSINTHKGCMQLDSVNYDATANFDDDSCIPSETKWEAGDYRYIGPDLTLPPYSTAPTTDSIIYDTDVYDNGSFHSTPSLHFFILTTVVLYLL